MSIREATADDWDLIWPIFHEVVSAGDTYAFDTDTTKTQAKSIWLDYPAKTFVYLEDNRLLASYYLKTNQAGPGSHVCNCGYMVASEARGKGLATALCQHSQTIARQLGYQAMQFNFVASSNTVAVKLWQKLGFTIVGRLPLAFNHPNLGLVDAYVMYKWLQENNH